MTRKTSPIIVMTTEDNKRKLKLKASEAGKSLTGYIEFIANNDIVVLDENFKKAARLFTYKSSKLDIS